MRGGGTAILIRQDIKHNEILLPRLKRMEATAIQLSINKELITLVSVYNPPGQIIERDLDLLISVGKKVILAGDFNAKHVMWRANRNNSAGQSLMNHYYKNNYIISAPTKPTHFPDNNPTRADILDLAIVSNVLANYSIRTLGSLCTSDHNPVLMTFCGSLQTDETKPNYIYRDADWKLFQTYLVGRPQYSVPRW
jgi:exonuclease III